MTFSICVRERYTDPEGEDQYRFGVAVTTRLAAVGTLCPFANEYGAVATQNLVNVELGERGVECLADGLHVEDALDALLAADDGAAQRQLHGVDRNGTFAFSGEECKPWYGHREEDDFTVAGNLLVGEETIDVTAEPTPRPDTRCLLDPLAPATTAPTPCAAGRTADRRPRDRARRRRQARGPPRAVRGTDRHNHRGPCVRTVLRRPPRRRLHRTDRGPPRDLRAGS